MKKIGLKILSFLIVIAIIFSACSKDNGDNETEDNTVIESGTPYFTFKIGSRQPVTVNCERITFVAESGGDHIQPVLGKSESINSTFSYAYYGSSAIMDTLKSGEFPLIPYTGWSSKIPMHFSLKAPRTEGENDFYLTTADSSSQYKHLIESIEKKDVESGMRVYYVNGSYNLKAENIIDNEIVDISGQYHFKLLTVEE